MKIKKTRSLHKGPIDIDALDAMLVEAGFSYYFWDWDTLHERDVPLLEVYTGNIIDERHDKFRATMLEREVRVKFINNSRYTKP